MDLLAKDNEPIMHAELTKDLIRIFYKVYNALGYGFLENVYQNAMYIELQKNGYNVVPQKKIEVYYAGRCVGDYYADIVVDDTVILELKAVEYLDDAHACQIINYLRATEYEVGLLMNFGPKPEVKRRIFSNENKGGYLSE